MSNETFTSVERYYASEKYVLPADKTESWRLDMQHRIFVKAFENRLSVAPVQLKSSDRVLESAAGTGLWTLQFDEERRKNGILLDIECIDISDKQFTKEYPSNIHFSLHSVTNLPSEWNDTFSYAHQRLLVLALDKTLWRQAVNEMFRVLKPGGRIELVEMDFQSYQIGVGPYSSKLQSLILKMFPDKGYLLNLAENLLSILKNGFVNIQVEMRQVRVGGGEEAMECGYKSKEMATFVRALKRDVMIGNGYGFVETEEEYEELVRGAEKEWDDHPCQGSHGLFVIIAQKP